MTIKPTFPSSTPINNSEPLSKQGQVSRLIQLFSGSPSLEASNRTSPIKLNDVSLTPAPLELSHPPIFCDWSDYSISHLNPNQASEGAGAKYAGIVAMEKMVDSLAMDGIRFATKQAIPAQNMEAFLNPRLSELKTLWAELERIYDESEGTKLEIFDDPQVMKCLAKVKSIIEETFVEAKSLDELGLGRHQSWLQKLADQGSRVIVRSSGDEDKKLSQDGGGANAGGNLSLVCPADEMSYLKALGQVLASYVSPGSLSNRILTGENPFEVLPKFSAMAMEFIGEPEEGASNKNEIPVSMVVFSHEPMFVGDEEWRVTRISASWGAGEGVVSAVEGINTDNFLVMHSESDPDHLIIFPEVREKKKRLVMDSDGNGKVVDNPQELWRAPCLTGEQLAKISAFAQINEDHQGAPQDMELLVIDKEIVPLQTRTLNRRDVEATYVDRATLTTLKNSPILAELPLHRIPTAPGSVIRVQDPSQILVVPSLEVAEKERLFDPETHKVIITHSLEPDNSHPVVNFSERSVPCFYVQDPKTLSALMEQKVGEQEWVIDGQTATLLLWDSKTCSLDSHVKTGYIETPAQVGLSVITTPEVNLSPVSTLPLDKQEQLDALKNALTSNSVESVAENAIEALATIGEDLKKEVRDYIAELHHSSSPSSEDLKALEIALHSLDSLSGLLVAELKTNSLNNEPRRMRELLLLKGVLQLVDGENSASTSQVGQIDLKRILQAQEDLKALNRHREIYGPKARMGRLSLYGQDLLDDSRWNSLIATLEKAYLSGEISDEKVDTLEDLVNDLRKMGLLDFWLQHEIPEDSQEIQKALKDLISNSAKLRNDLGEIVRFQSQCQALIQDLEPFPSLEAIERMEEQVLNQLYSLNSEDVFTQLQAGGIRGQAMLQSLQLAVDLQDEFTKVVKLSINVPRPKREELFLRHVESFSNSLLNLFGNEKNPIWEAQSRTACEEFHNWVADSIHTEGYDGDPFLASSEFQVPENLAWIEGGQLGAGEHSPCSVEDYFSLVHRSFLSIIERLSDSLAISTSFNGTDFAEICEEIGNLKVQMATSEHLPSSFTQFLGLQCPAPKFPPAAIGYNKWKEVPMLGGRRVIMDVNLRVHGCRFTLTQRKGQDHPSLTLEMTRGANEYGRFDLLGAALKIYADVYGWEATCGSESWEIVLQPKYRKEIFNFFQRALDVMDIAGWEHWSTREALSRRAGFQSDLQALWQFFLQDLSQEELLQSTVESIQTGIEEGEGEEGKILQMIAALSSLPSEERPTLVPLLLEAPQWGSLNPAEAMHAYSILVPLLPDSYSALELIHRITEGLEYPNSGLLDMYEEHIAAGIKHLDQLLNGPFTTVWDDITLRPKQITQIFDLLLENYSDGIPEACLQISECLKGAELSNMGSLRRALLRFQARTLIRELGPRDFVNGLIQMDDPVATEALKELCKSRQVKRAVGKVYDQYATQKGSEAKEMRARLREVRPNLLSKKRRARKAVLRLFK